MFQKVIKNSDASTGFNLEESQSSQKDDSLEFSFFDQLPIEIFLYICSFLEVKDMIMILSRVCRRFHDILGDETIWKSWIAKRFYSRYPIVPTEDNFDWRRSCFDIEKEWNLWIAKDEKIRYINVNDVHVSSCDAIVFNNTGSLCISGSRDRSIVLWNPHLLCQRPYQLIQHQVAHDGWIWRLIYVDDTLYSCSWDNTVKSWSLQTSGLQAISTFSCSSPALAMTSINGLIVAGDYGKTVYGFDPRATTEPQFTYLAHHRAVLALGSNDFDIISGSEDKTIAIWDSRTKSIRQRLELGKFAYPNCLDVENKSIFVGDSKGAIHVFSSISGKMSLISTFEMGHTKAISVLKQGRGYLITGSLDGTVKISLPTYPPQVITTVKSNGGQIGGLDYCNGMLATGSANCVEFWIPQELMISC